MLAAAQVELKLGNSAALARAAERVGALAPRLAAGLDGRALGGIDAMLPAPAACKGRAHP